MELTTQDVWTAILEQVRALVPDLGFGRPRPLQAELLGCAGQSPFVLARGVSRHLSRAAGTRQADCAVGRARVAFARVRHCNKAPDWGGQAEGKADKDPPKLRKLFSALSAKYK